MSNANDQRPLLTVREVAEILRVSPSLVYQLVEAQQLACHRIGSRKGAIRIAPADVDDYLARCRNERRDDTPKSKPSHPRLKHVKL
jgi:excisionase family DNA binding protein